MSDQIVQHDGPAILSATAEGRVGIDFDNQLVKSLLRFAKKPEDAATVAAPLPPCLEREWKTRLNIVVQVIGSRGDVQPFVALGCELRRSGHRVRIATHAAFKAFVLESGLEFYPAGGDPQELMAYMVKNPSLLPSMSAMRSGEIGKKRKIMALTLEGCWRSCISPDPDTHEPFVANAIIANPVSFAHVHCAQALGVPLHIMFTMPWTATKSFPHPLANIKGSEVGMGRANYWSYHFVSYLAWQGLADVINAFREHTLGLAHIPLTEGPTMLETLQIPHTYCWSSALIPKPRDWPSYIDVTGFIFRQPPFYQAPTELEEFLSGGSPPVYIGFGSIVVEDPQQLTSTILEAIGTTGVRAIVSPGWSSLASVEKHTNSDVFFLTGDCPHEWLFQQVTAVVHHGGAGTTTCGLRNRKPTVVVSFFGDQIFWGDMIFAAGAGPRPIPFETLTAETLAEGLEFCLSEKAQVAAYEIATRMCGEEGAQAAATSFYRHLSADVMACDIVPEYPASWLYRHGSKTIKLSVQAAESLLLDGSIKAKHLDLYSPCPLHLRHRRWDPATGVMAAMGETTTGMLNEVMGFWKRPVDLHERRLAEAVLAQQTRPTNERESKETARNSPAHVAQMVGSSLSSAPRFMGQMLKGFVVDVPLAVTEGLRATPQLYGDKVEHLEPVNDWKSGSVVAGKHFVASSKSAACDLWDQPEKGYAEEGMQSIGKGLVKGLVGSLTKTGSAITGLVAYPGDGIAKSMHSLFHINIRNTIADAKRVEGRVWLHKDHKDFIAEAVVNRFQLMQGNRDKLQVAKRRD
ncbi:uncharacterized protein HMPREF1541_03506 [Cyphellophora europaea CBS 101466]|uniref:Uncharacterized protein n=1 Tax=Cyphellophora europaea (strain CBS 101466) TaxID=1220924 RepID=W2RZ10_CYPE1|nr:uncharacterized protein HMPREF1541_03506 [Cyphellophora europaea CBS 101466]ETN41570.1 hypothetical protein HMPREF1541_03506 [Cyphellophora europaea CBS 101466]